MLKKVQAMTYTTVAQFRADFDLMLRNCFQYNRETSIYCVAAARMQKQSGPIFKSAEELVDQCGLIIADASPDEAVTPPRSDTLMTVATPSEQSIHTDSTEPTRNQHSPRAASTHPHHPLESDKNPISVSRNTRSQLRVPLAEHSNSNKLPFADHLPSRKRR